MKKYIAASILALSMLAPVAAFASTGSILTCKQEPFLGKTTITVCTVNVQNILPTPPKAPTPPTFPKGFPF